MPTISIKILEVWLFLVSYLFFYFLFSNKKMAFEYSGFYKRTKESDKDQPKYRYIFIDEEDIMITQCFDNHGNILTIAKCKDYQNSHVHFRVHDEISRSKCKRVVSKNQRSSNHNGFGSKFGKEAMKYKSSHNFCLIEDHMTYGNTYTFENGETSIANYIRIADCPIW